MAALVDASSPAAADINTPAGSGDPMVGTTATFDPPTCLLVIVVNVDTNTGATPTLAMTNNGGALTWTTQVERGDSEGTAGYVAWATAELTAGRTGMTVTATLSNHALTSVAVKVGSLKVYCVTGYNTSTPLDSIGANNENSSTTNSISTTSLTPGANGLLFAAGTDWNQLGTPTSSNLTIDAGDISGHISYIRGYRTCSSGVGLTANLDAAGASAADWNWAQLIVREAAGGGGGSTTTKTMTDTLATTDAALDPTFRVRLMSDTSVVGDAEIDYLRLVRLPTDTVNVTDAFYRYLQLRRTSDDSLTILDSVVQQLSGSGLIITKVVSETLILTDGTIRILNFVRAQTDNISTVSEGGTYRQVIVTASEDISLTDNTVEVVRFKRIAEDALALIDAFSKSVGSAGGITYARVLSDSMTMIDSAGQRWTMRTSRLSDTISPSDAALRALARIRIHGDVIEVTDGNVSVRRTVRFAQDTLDVPDELIRSLILDQVYNVDIRFGNFDPFRFGGQ